MRVEFGQRRSFDSSLDMLKGAIKNFCVSGRGSSYYTIRSVKLIPSDTVAKLIGLLPHHGGIGDAEEASSDKSEGQGSGDSVRNWGSEESNEADESD